MEENDQIKYLKIIDRVHVRAEVVECKYGKESQVDCCVTAGLPLKGNVTIRKTNFCPGPALRFKK